MSIEELVAKIDSLPPERQREVEAFIDKLSEEDKPLTFEGAAEKVFRQHSELLKRLADS